MARPEEKAQAMLNKWIRMREERNDPNSAARRKKRPFLASQCENVHEAERWRRQIIGEIAHGVAQIQNAGMGEHAIRDLNDQINKLFREKHHWNKRILELGGPNYIHEEKKQQLEEEARGGGSGAEADAAAIGGSGGYRYFGAAKDLPGVKELFARQASKVTKRKRGDIYKYITPDYYGLRDEEDGVLLELEEEASQKRRLNLEREHQKSAHDGDDKEEEEEDEITGIGGVTGAADAIAAHVAIPTQEIVRQTLLEQKKKDLLDRLAV